MRPAASLPAYFELTKPGITLYVMILAGVSAAVGTQGEIGLLTLLHAVLGTGLATGGALAINQYVERDVDAVMTRTRQRPLPSGRLRPPQALAFGVALLVGGIAYLAVAGGWLAAGLAAVSGFSYLAVYTPLKRHSYAATLVGAVPGALPALMGWSAATGSLTLGAASVFAIAYLWQLPHVLGLAWMLRDDYALVGFKLIPQGGARRIGAHMVISTLLLVPASVTPTLLGLTGSWYFGGALIASLALLVVAVRAAGTLAEGGARRLFLASLLYQPVLLALMALDVIL